MFSDPDSLTLNQTFALHWSGCIISLKVQFFLLVGIIISVQHPELVEGDVGQMEGGREGVLSMGRSSHAQSWVASGRIWAETRVPRQAQVI